MELVEPRFYVLRFGPNVLDEPNGIPEHYQCHTRRE